MRTITTAFDLVEAVVQKTRIEGICWACAHKDMCPCSGPGVIVHFNRTSCERFSNRSLEETQNSILYTT